MNPTLSEISIAIVMVAVSVALLVWILRSMAASSERRMTRMLKRAGLDPEIAKHGDPEAVIHEIRARCRKCSSEALCERWLAGEEEGNNSFCPNAQVFETLRGTTKAAGAA
jgi:hypothetical protein